jgi:hypothetical protein
MHPSLEYITADVYNMLWLYSHRVCSVTELLLTGF